MASPAPPPSPGLHCLQGIPVSLPPLHSCRSGLPVLLNMDTKASGPPAPKPFKISITKKEGDLNMGDLHIVHFNYLTMDQVSGGQAGVQRPVLMIALISWQVSISYHRLHLTCFTLRPWQTGDGSWCWTATGGVSMCYLGMRVCLGSARLSCWVQHWGTSLMRSRYEADQCN
jgi:hypothetical protein